MCGLCQPNFSGMSGVVGYLYESAKDSIKWHNKKPKEFINLVMSIGRLVYLSEEDFSKTLNNSNADSMSDDDVRKFYEDYREKQKIKERKDG